VEVAVAKIRCTALIQVNVKCGEAKFPDLDPDDGTIKKLQEFLSREEIFPFTLQYSGGGQYIALFDAPDGVKVQSFLESLKL